MPSCVNPAVHDARETAGASNPGCFFFYILFMVPHSVTVTHANITVFISQVLWISTIFIVSASQL